MSVVEKRAYYRGQAVKSRLAERYFCEFGTVRKILDVGCGTGDFGQYRPLPGVTVYGVDHDARALAVALKFQKVIRADLEFGGLPYRDGSFDGVLAKDIFEHLQNPGQLGREIFRVMRPGGILIASVVMAKPRRVWADYTHVRGFTKGSARLLLEDAGFTVEKVWRMGGVPLSNRLRVIRLVPYLLRLPVFDQLWAASWELKARK